MNQPSYIDNSKKAQFSTIDERKIELNNHLIGGKGQTKNQIKISHAQGPSKYMSKHHQSTNSMGLKQVASTTSLQQNHKIVFGAHYATRIVPTDDNSSTERTCDKKSKKGLSRMRNKTAEKVAKKMNKDPSIAKILMPSLTNGRQYNLIMPLLNHHSTKGVPKSATKTKLKGRKVTPVQN